MIAGALKVDEGDVSLQVSRHIRAMNHGVHLGIDSHLVHQITLVQQGTQMQSVALDVARETAGPWLAG